MKSVHKTVLVAYTPAQMFQLVSDVPAYPQFLPWCDFARVIEKTANGKVAEVGIGMGGIRQSFVTRNVERPDRQIDIHLVRGPFSQLHGHWRFDEAGAGAQPGCRVCLELHYSFSNFLLGRLVGPVFDKIASTLVDAFTQRARKVYG